jgi:hypothetical protein
MDDLVYKLYELTSAEVRMVEAAMLPERAEAHATAVAA